MERHAPFAKPHTTSHFGPPQPSGYFNFDPLRALANSLLNSPFHRAAITNPTFQLARNILCDQKGIHIRVLDFFNIQVNLFANQSF